MSRHGRIRKLVKELTDRYRTNNPRELAECLDIKVIKFPFLGRVSGMLVSDNGTRLIGVNSSLPYHMQEAVIAHELGHAVLHPDQDYHFLTDCTYCCTDKLEAEANVFAKELILGNTYTIEDYYAPGESRYLYRIAEVRAKYEY